MRKRSLSAVLSCLLAAAGVAVVVARPADAAAIDPTARLYLHGASATYTEDSMKDPLAWEGYAPAGATTDTKPPTGTTSKTGITFEPTGSPGLPMAPTFALGATGNLTTACIDVFVAATNPGATFPIGVAFGAGPPEAGGKWTYPDIVQVAGSGVVRVTTMLTMEAPFALEEDMTIFFYLQTGAFNIDPDPAARPYTLSYDSVQHPSNVTLNATTCEPAPTPEGAPAAPGPSAPASAEPSAAPSAAPSADPSASAEPTMEPEPTDTAPSTSCASASASPAGSGEPTPVATDAASASATAAAVPAPAGLPPAPPSASASAAPSEPASEEPSAEPSGGASAAPGRCDPHTVQMTTSTLSITAGNAPTLSGVVRNARGDAIHGTTVTIYVKGYGESAYTAAATVETDRAGQFAIKVRPMKQSAFVAGAAAKRSRTLNIRVSTRMEITSPRAGSAVANPVTFTGRLTPGYVRVPVGLGYLRDGRFVVITQARTDGSGRYRLSARLPRGTSTFVVFTSAHQGTDKGSRSARLTVR